MAEQALVKIGEQLNCSICLDTYTDPKLLKCFHVYCRQCLVPLGVRDQQGQLSLTCPICRHVTPIPANGLTGLQSAFHINHLLEIQDSVKKLQNLVPSELEDSDKAVEKISRTSQKATVHCFEHAGEELKLHCETCDEVICMHCALKGSKHHSHNYVFLQKAFEAYQNEIFSLFEPMEKQVTAVKKALALIERRYGEIFDQRVAIEDNIHVTFRRLREVLTVRETELIGQLHKTTQGKLKGLAAQINQIETTLAQLDSCLHFMRESVKAGNESDVLMMKTNTVHQVKELTTPFQADTLKPNTEADIVFSALADLTAMCQSYGQVFASGSLDPSKCHTSAAKGSEVAVAGAKTTVNLQAVSYGSEPCEEPIKSLECELISEITGTRVSCSVERSGQSQYEVSYQPTIKGRHQLHIKVDGQHISGSPSSVAVKSAIDLKELGTPILTLGGVKAPYGVVISQRGEVVVTEGGGDCVSMFSSNGEKIQSFGTHGSGPGQFQCPRGIAIDGEGNIIVADRENHRIQKFTGGGRFITAVGTNGNGQLQFYSPIGIAYNTNNCKLYVADSCNCRIQVLNSDLTFSGIFGTQGSGKGQFDCPNGVACDSTGKVYVADTYNNRIQVFTLEGKFLKVFKGHVLKRPVGVAVDDDGITYVTESRNHLVSLLTSDGKLVKSFGRERTRQSDGVMVDNCGVVYVCDSKNNCINGF